MIGFLELSATLGHHGLGDGQGIGRIQGIERAAFAIMLPGGRKDLITRYFAAGTDGVVIIAGFDHGQGGEAVHGKRIQAHHETEGTQHDHDGAGKPPAASIKATSQRVRAAMTVASHTKNDAASTGPFVKKLPCITEAIINPGIFQEIQWG